MTLRKTDILLLIFLWAVIFCPATGLASEETKIIEAVQKKYDATKTFQADFIQKSYLKIMSRVHEAKGKVYIKKPGKMMWDYKAPDQQILITNDQNLWLYLPEQEQVSKTRIDSIYSSNAPALFLAGKGKLMDAFLISQVVPKEKTYSIVLYPKRESQNVERMVLYIDKKNFQIIGSSVYDKLGNKTEMIFSKIKINLPLSNDLFDFKVPEGVEVIDYSAR